MPTYVCTIKEGRLSPDQKSRIAGEITRIHCEVTGAPTFFAQVIFEEVKSGQLFHGRRAARPRSDLRIRPGPSGPQHPGQAENDKAHGRGRG
jgi:phenylpyruvate tautomerase PptA (4-oxalocrotonate tautomerase family)